MFRIPLAWLQLKREKPRLLVAVAGVAFAVMLIFMQLGFRNALFQSAVRFHMALDADLVLISPHLQYLASPTNFSRRRLYQAPGMPGVASVSPVYMAPSLWKNPLDGSTRTIFLVGVDPTKRTLTLPQVNAQLDKLRIPDVVLYDEAARPEFGPIAETVRSGRTVSTEVSNRRVTVAGLFELGTSFGIDATLITSDLNFLRIHPSRDSGLINIGLIRLTPGTDARAVRERLTARLPRDVLVLTKAQYMDREKVNWARRTPIGYVFNFGSIMGFVVGAIIVYQVLFANVADHLREYATLKAMGYPNSFLFSVVLQEAIILAVLGYLPGLGICVWLYRLTENATRLPMTLTPELGGFVLLVAIVMCGLSGAIALRKVRSADPAEIF